MARALSKREIGYGVVLGIAGVVYLWMRSGPAPEAPTETAAAHAKAVAAASVAPKVRTDLLAATNVPHYDPAGRDLFQYAVRPPSAEELRQRAEEAERQRKVAELEAQRRLEDQARQAELRKAQVAEMALHPPKPQPPSINLKYTGYIGPKDDKCAVLEDGDEQLVVKKGETVKGQFVVLDIKGETVVMGFTNPAFKGQTRELSLSPNPQR